MALYEDLYIRMNLSDSGTVPRPATGGTSPDVIPYGIDAVPDPQTFFSANYDQNVSKPLVFETGKQNHIYVRVKNYGGLLNKGRIYLYYALDSELNSPEVWSKNVIKPASGGEYISVTANKKGDIVVTREAFLWSPPVLPEGQNYNLIARVSTKKHPNEIPTAIPDFADYVANDGGSGWQTPVMPPPPSEVVWTTTVPFAQGDTERLMYFMLEGENITTDSQVSISSSTGDITLNKTKVATSPFQLGLQKTIPAGFTCNLSFTLWNKDKNAQPADSFVKLRVYYKEKSGSGPSRDIVVLWAKTNN